MKNLSYNNGEEFINFLSDFWVIVFQDEALMQRFSSAYGEIFGDAYFDFLELVLSVSIEKIKPFNRRKWHFLSFKQSENLGEAKLIYDNEGILYGPQFPPDSEFTVLKEFDYDGRFSTEIVYRYVLPENMVDIDKFLCNRIHQPSLVLIKDKDFTVKDRIIRFTVNPFENDLIAKREIRSVAGQVTDREIGIWSLNSFWDYDSIFKRYGKLIKFYRKNGEVYKTFINALWALFYDGPNFKNLVAAINSLIGATISRDNEEIRSISVFPTETILLTNKNKYSIDPAAPIRADFFDANGNLKPNIQLEKFEALTDSVSIKDYVNSPKWWNKVDPLLLPNYLLGGNKSFFLPDIDILAVFRLGETWGLPLEFEVPDLADIKTGIILGEGTLGNVTLGPAEEIANNSWREIGVRLGGVVLGEQAPGIPYSNIFNFKDYVMDNFFKENLFFMQITPTVSQFKNFQRQIIDIILEAIPARSIFINYTFLETFEDDFALEDVAEQDYNTGIGSLDGVLGSGILFDGKTREIQHNNDSAILELGFGIPLTEEAATSESIGYDEAMQLGYETGYNGYPYLGNGQLLGQFLGTFGFQPGGLLVRSICGT